VSSDLVALAMSYQRALTESLSVLDDIKTETFKGSFASDNVTTSDQPLTAMVYARTLSMDVLGVSEAIVAGLLADRTDANSLAVSDTVTAGLWHDVVSTDVLAVTESWTVATEYNRAGTDTLLFSDAVHTWKALDGALQVDLEGEATLKALLLKGDDAPSVLTAEPPRSVTLPKTPPEVALHYVVNPNPPDRDR
jgi:hypothetical protein